MHINRHTRQLGKSEPALWLWLSQWLHKMAPLGGLGEECLQALCWLFNSFL